MNAEGCHESGHVDDFGPDLFKSQQGVPIPCEADCWVETAHGFSDASALSVGSAPASCPNRVDPDAPWVATVDAEWVSLSRDHGTTSRVIDVMVEEKMTGSSRTATVTLGGVERLLTQEALYRGLPMVIAVGSDQDGQPGLNRILQRKSPAALGMADVVQVAISGNDSIPFVLDVKTDGPLWAMGCNGYGQSGDRTTTNRSAPVPLAERRQPCGCAVSQRYHRRTRRLSEGLHRPCRLTRSAHHRPSVDYRQLNRARSRPHNSRRALRRR